MLARIPKLRAALLLIVSISCLGGCATQKEVALVDDPDAKKESAIPWNKQEKWEQGGGQFAGLSDLPH